MSQSRTNSAVAGATGSLRARRDRARIWSARDLTTAGKERHERTRICIAILGDANHGSVGRRCRRRHRRRRWRRWRAARRAVQPLAGQRSRAAREGAGAGRHCPQGGVLVLGAEQQANARSEASRTTESGCLRYMARLSRPQLYDPDHPTFGMSEWEFELCRGIYAVGVRGDRDVERARRDWSTATAPRCPTTGPSSRRTTRRQAGSSCPPRHVSRCPTVGGCDPDDERGRRARRRDIRTGHRVQRLVAAGRRVVGVEASTLDGQTHRVRRPQGGDLRHRRIHPRS